MEEARIIHQNAENEPGKLRDSEDAFFLEQFIGEEAASFMGILRSYVVQYKLARGKEDIQEEARELFQNIYIEAIKSLARFDRSRSIRAWLLGIARNLVLRKQASLGKRKQHETLMCELRQSAQEQESDKDPLERLLSASQPGPEHQVEIREQFAYLLSQLSEKHQYVLRLWAVEGLDGTELAEKLGCSHKNAIVRLHRARKKLRTVAEKGGRNG